MRTDEQTIRMASTLYQARDTAKFLLKDKYASVMADAAKDIRAVMKRYDIGEMEATIKLAQAIKDDGRHLALLLSACVEMIEPSILPASERTLKE